MYDQDFPIYLDRWIISNDKFFWIFVVEMDEVVKKARGRWGAWNWESNTEEIWSAFFNAVEVWVGALYLMEADKTWKLYVRDTPIFSAASWRINVITASTENGGAPEADAANKLEEGLVCGPPSFEPATTIA